MGVKETENADATIFWHYTTRENFDQILQDELIKLTAVFVPKSERPIVWFSANQVWEPTANKAWRNSDGTIISLNMEQTAALGGGLARIGVASDIARYDWNALKELSGMSSKMAQGLYKAAIHEGSRPGQWRGTFDPVPTEKWIRVEVFSDGAWVPFLVADLTSSSIDDSDGSAAL